MILGTVFALVGFYTMLSTAAILISMVPACLKIPVHLVVQMEVMSSWNSKGKHRKSLNSILAAENLPKKLDIFGFLPF